MEKPFAFNLSLVAVGVSLLDPRQRAGAQSTSVHL